MKISKRFASTYLKASDLEEDVTLTIGDVVEEEVGDGDKLVLYFEEESAKPVILNKTNALTLSEMYGDDTSDWAGQPVTLTVMSVDYQGKRTDGIRVKKPRRASTPKPNTSPSGKTSASPVSPAVK